jgi:hypothetical protein
MTLFERQTVKILGSLPCMSCRLLLVHTGGWPWGFSVSNTWARSMTMLCVQASATEASTSGVSLAWMAFKNRRSLWDSARMRCARGHIVGWVVLSLFGAVGVDAVLVCFGA